MLHAQAFKNRFESDDRQWVEMSVACLFVSELRAHYRFLDFVLANELIPDDEPVTEGEPEFVHGQVPNSFGAKIDVWGVDDRCWKDADKSLEERYQLRIHLDSRRPNADKQDKEYIFLSTIGGKGRIRTARTDREKTVAMPFRSSKRWRDKVGDQQTLVEEIDLLVRDKDYRRELYKLGNLLSRISLTDNVKILHANDRLSWLAGVYGCDHLCIDFESRLEVEHMTLEGTRQSRMGIDAEYSGLYVTSAANGDFSWHGAMLLEPAERYIGGDHLAKVTGLYVTDYKRWDSTCENGHRPRRPDDEHLFDRGHFNGDAPVDDCYCCM